MSSDGFKKALGVSQKGNAASTFTVPPTSGVQSVKLTQGYSGINTLNIYNVGVEADYKKEWTTDQWVGWLERNCDYPEFQEALKLMNSKLYKELK